LLTNPTHVAVALKYVPGTSPAPQVLAKGAGGLARKMREAAARSGVPIVHSPELARALFKEVGSDHYIPERWYPQVARILVWIEASRRARVHAGSPQTVGLPSGALA
jgi:flagellar biosynthetic protein FlhB